MECSNDQTVQRAQTLNNKNTSKRSKRMVRKLKPKLSRAHPHGGNVVFFNEVLERPEAGVQVKANDRVTAPPGRMEIGLSGYLLFNNGLRVSGQEQES